MKKSAILLVLIFLSLATVYAQSGQFPSQVWHKGNIYLTDGITLSGLIKYDLESNLVQLQSPRRFYSLPYAINGEYETPTFFEVLTEGNDIVLLCREYISTDTRGMNNWGPVGMNPFWGPQNNFGYRLAFNYYFFKNGRLERYSLKSGHDEEISLFMRKNRLEHDKRGDLLRITAYYNELKN